MTVLSFQEKILRASLNMISPDVMIDDGKGTVLLSSEEDETEDNLPKLLSVSLLLLSTIQYNVYGVVLRIRC